MHSLIERVVLSLALTCLLASGASAQVVVQGILQPDDIQLHEEERLAASHKATKPWSLGFGWNEGYESNPSGAPDAAGDLSTLFTASGGRGWAFSRGSLGVSGSAGENVYRQTSGSNQFNYGVGANTSWLVSPRLSFNVGDSVSTGYAKDATNLQDSELLPPNLVTHLNTASGGLNYDLSSRGRLHWGITQQNTSFGSSQVRGPSEPSPTTSTLSTAMSFDRQLTRSQTLGVSSEYQHAAANGGSSGQGGIMATWARAFGKDVSVNGAFGLRMYTLPGESGIQTAPGGSIGVTARVRHADTLSVRYDRSTTIEQAAGALTHLGDSVSADYGLKLGRRVSVGGSAYYARSVFPLDPNHKRYGHTGNLSAAFSLVPGLALAVNYGFYTRVDTPSPPLSGYSAGMSLRYGLNF